MSSSWRSEPAPGEGGGRRRLRVLVALLVVAGTSTVFTPSAHAQSFVVASTADAADADAGDGICADGTGTCTLRAAVEEANATPGTDTITLPPGVYTLAAQGSGENNGATGDLDIRSDIIINGSGTASTVIEQSVADRVIDVRPGGSLTLTSLSVRGGADQHGAGIRAADATVNLTGVELRANTAGGHGGGLRATGSFVTLDRVTVSANTAGGHGGGISLEDSSLTAVNSTVSGNTSATRGGGIRVEAGAAALSFVTIALNGAPDGGGLATDSRAALSIVNTIVAGNAGGNCDRHVASDGHNLDSGTTCGLGGPGDQSNADPLLAPLAYNGGGTRSHALQPGSPGIDTGAASCTSGTDQRGVARPQDGDAVPGAICDIGSYEALRGDNWPPVLEPIGTQGHAEGDRVSLVAVATDQNLPDTVLTWSATGLPDGLAIDPATGRIAGVITHRAAGGSPYTVIVTVTDDGTPALADAVTFQWTVSDINRPPTLGELGNVVGDELTTITFTAQGSDPDGDDVRFELGAVTEPVPEGATIDPDTGVFSWVPAAEQGPAVYDIRVLVVDDGHPAMSAEGIVTITVVEPNLPPQARLDRLVMQEDDVLIVDALANDTDPESDELRIMGVEPPLHGEVLQLDAGALTYRPDPNWHGTEWLLYRIADGVNPAVRGTVEIVVTPVNDAPTAVDATVALEAGESITIDFRTLTDDVDGDELTITTAAEPIGAVMEWHDGLTLEITAKVGAEGEMRIPYRVSDGNGAASNAVVSVEVSGPAYGLGVGRLALGAANGTTPPEQLPALGAGGPEFTGMRLVVGSVYQTFSLFRLPGLLFAGVFALSLAIGTRRTVTLAQGAVHLRPGRRRKMVSIMLGPDRTLVARTEPGNHADILHRFPGSARDLAATGRRAQIGSQVCVEIVTPLGNGWVDDTFVAEQVGPASFESDGRPVRLIERLVDVLAEAGDLTDLTIERGIYVAYHSEPELIPHSDLPNLLTSRMARTWWAPTGDRPTIQGTFRDVIAGPLAQSLSSYELRADTAPSTPVPSKLSNLPRLGVSHPLVPGKDGWWIFFEYVDGEPLINAIWRDAPINQASHGGPYRQ